MTQPAGLEHSRTLPEIRFSFSLTHVRDELNLETAACWLRDDARDDFIPDPIQFRDIAADPKSYIDARKHDIFRPHGKPALRSLQPKSKLLLRPALYLHPQHRIVLLAILHYFLPRIGPVGSRNSFAYTYNPSTPPDRYPYQSTTTRHRWMEMHNEVRSACLDSRNNAVAETDLSNYYPHIEVARLLTSIEAMLGDSLRPEDRSVLSLFESFLRQWSSQGFGIPQNLDPCSFFGSLYCNGIDVAMEAQRYQMYRWVDDIKIVTKDRSQAIRALHFLQEECEKRHLFLNSRKTRVIERGSTEFESLLDVSDDVLLSQIDDALHLASASSVDSAFELAKDGFLRHATSEGDDKKLRAFIGKLLDVGTFDIHKDKVSSLVKPVLMAKFSASPHQAEHWTKMLCGIIDSDVESLFLDNCVTKPSLHDSHRMWSWRGIGSCTNRPSAAVLSRAKELATSTLSDPVSSQAILVLGKHGSNADREFLAESCFSEGRSYLLQRSVIVACQELPEVSRSRFYNRVGQAMPDHRELLHYLLGQKDPIYGFVKPRQSRTFAVTPAIVDPRPRQGVGLIKGTPHKFAFAKYGAPFYE